MKLVNQLVLPCILGSSAFMAYAQDRANDDNDIDIATIKDNNDQRIKKSSTATKTPFNIRDISQTITSVNLEQQKIYG